MPVASALIGASVTTLLYLAQKYADRTKARRVALGTFYYFTHSLAEALHHPVSGMNHVDLSVLNDHLPALLAIKNFDVMLQGSPRPLSQMAARQLYPAGLDFGGAGETANC